MQTQPTDFGSWNTHPARRTTILVWIAGLTLAAAAAPASVFYVRTNGDDAMPGTSWELAKRKVNSAVAAASAGDEIWVAQGTYAEHVTFRPGVALYGGFVGSEDARAQRDWTNHLSIVWGTTNRAVVTITNAGPETRLDGFTVGGGNAIHGGGIAMLASGPVIANNTIRNNITDGCGAGINVWGFHILSSTDLHFPIITNNVIAANQSINDEGDGGGIGVVGSSPLIAWNLIVLNTASRNGGGIACWRNSLPTIANNLIEANSASFDELTVSEGGGAIFASATDFDGRPIEGAISAPLIINNVIAANGGYSGGGITLIDSRLGAARILNNTIIANTGAGVYWANTWPTNDNNLVAFNTHGFERGLAGTSDAVIRYNDVFGNAVLGGAADYRGTADRTGTEANISVEPKLANRAIGEFHLQPDSPCVDSGSSALAATDWLDVDRQPRQQGKAVDIGADESDGKVWNVPTPVVRVSPSGDDTSGQSWATAKKTISAGLAAAAATGGQVWVAQGTYHERVMPPAFTYLYGGFAGSETIPEARDPAAHPTVLDGSGVAPVVYYRNAGYLVSALDGFTVRNGGVYTAGDPLNPDLTKRLAGRGGALYCRVSSPTIANNLLCTNSLGSPFTAFDASGGGIYCYLSHAQVTGNTFQDNEVLNAIAGAGGGLYCLFSKASIEGNSFRRNQAHSGAAIYGNGSELRLVGNLVETNSLYPAYPYQGAAEGALTFNAAPNLLVEANTIRGNVAAVGGGLSLETCLQARVQNNLFLDNLAFDFSGFGQGGMGGGIYALVNINAGDTLIANNTFVGNNAPPTISGAMGGAMAFTLLTNRLTIANNIIAGNSSGLWRDWRTSIQAVLHCNCLYNTNGNDYLNLSAGSDDILADPGFVSRAAGDFHLLAGSPCVDAAASAYGPAADKDGVRRPLDGRASGTAAYDVGAYEFVNALADTDRDGMLDAAECVAGTDPTDAASFLKLDAHLSLNGSVALLGWHSVTGRSYQVQFKPTWAADWQSLTNGIPGNGAELGVADHAPGNAQRFYRLAVTSP